MVKKEGCTTTMSRQTDTTTTSAAITTTTATTNLDKKLHVLFGVANVVKDGRHHARNHATKMCVLEACRGGQQGEW